MNRAFSAWRVRRYANDLGRCPRLLMNVAPLALSNSQKKIDDGDTVRSLASGFDVDSLVAGAGIGYGLDDAHEANADFEA
jgi:hypothetical protein